MTKVHESAGMNIRGAKALKADHFKAVQKEMRTYHQAWAQFPDGVFPSAQQMQETFFSSPPGATEEERKMMKLLFCDYMGRWQLTRTCTQVLHARAFLPSQSSTCVYTPTRPACSLPAAAAARSAAARTMPPPPTQPGGTAAASPQPQQVRMCSVGSTLSRTCIQSVRCSYRRLVPKLNSLLHDRLHPTRRCHQVQHPRTTTLRRWTQRMLSWWRMRCAGMLRAQRVAPSLLPRPLVPSGLCLLSLFPCGRRPPCTIPTLCAAIPLTGLQRRPKCDAEDCTGAGLDSTGGLFPAFEGGREVVLPQLLIPASSSPIPVHRQELTPSSVLVSQGLHGDTGTRPLPGEPQRVSAHQLLERLQPPSMHTILHPHHLTLSGCLWARH